MKARSVKVGLGLALVLACTDATLFGDNRQNPPDELTVKGYLCTDDPTEREFPVRVLFVVDTSISDGNYIALRGDSVERILRSYGGANYSWSVIRYGGPLKGTSCGLRNLTPDGYTKTLDDAVAGVRCADIQNPGRDLMDALSLSSAFVSGDVIQTDLGHRSRTKYVIIVLANGPPSVDLSSQWCNSRSPRIPDDQCDQAFFDTFCDGVQPPPDDCERYQYVRVIREMRGFAEENGVQELFLHVVYQRDPDDASAGVDNTAAMDLYADMALHGGGTLYRFPGPASCNVTAGDSSGCLFSMINLDSTQAVFQRRQLIATNRNARSTGFGLAVDTDGDGLTDEVELDLGTSIRLIDTDEDNLNDRLEHVLRSVGLDPLRHERDDPAGAWPAECPLPGSPNPNAFPPSLDQDGDGLTDCEEILLRSDPTLFDSDSDGVPDPLEFRYGTNLIANDGKEDKEADGFANIDEYRYHLDPLSKDRSLDDAYRYQFRNEEQKMVVAFTQPYQVTGVEIIRASQESRDGRGTVSFVPPPDVTLPVSPENPAGLTWHDPGDESGPEGAEIVVDHDGRYTLPSADFVEGDPAADYSIEVDVITEILPKERKRTDVRLRASLRQCFDFEIKHIQLVDTASAADTGVAGVNYVDLFLSEVPTNNPGSYGVFRAATVPAYLNPDPRQRDPQPTVELASEDFLLFGQ
ncbi:MAG: hypothetical protein HY791_37740 [Deltaproteobacteria bacterium]|nr:hypothetical protein [Deltaproteobacteria bacterium]